MGALGGLPSERQGLPAGNLRTVQQKPRGENHHGACLSGPLCWPLALTLRFLKSEQGVSSSVIMDTFKYSDDLGQAGTVAPACPVFPTCANLVSYLPPHFFGGGNLLKQMAKFCYFAPKQFSVYL